MARITVEYFCANGHLTRPAFAERVEIPVEWECVQCGLPAGQDPTQPPPAPEIRPYKTHLAYVQERRSAAEADAILAEALGRLRERRNSGEVWY